MIGESMLLPVDVYELDLGHVGGVPPHHVRRHGAGVRGVTCRGTLIVTSILLESFKYPMREGHYLHNLLFISINVKIEDL